jgi:hypothetical protein
MIPNLDDTSNVAFRMFTMGPHDVPQVKIWDEAPVGRGKAWDRIGYHLKGHGQHGQYPNQQHTELSIRLVEGKTTYVISFGNDMQTVFGPGNPPITLLPPSFSTEYLSNVGLVFPGASGAPDFTTSIPADFDKLPAGAALMFTCDRLPLELAWKNAFKDHGRAVPLAMPFFLNLYDAKSQLPVWSSDMHLHMQSGEAASHVETHGGIHPGGKNPPDGGKPGGVTHGGIHPSSNVQLLY